jgi:23S rRNA pseudouridine955/2504/2580 synthase
MPPTLEELLARIKDLENQVDDEYARLRTAFEERRSALAGRFLELVHRLDRETSGVLLLAKKRAALVKMHEMLRDGKTDKRYLMLVKGRWRDEKRTVKLPLHKFVTASGERRVMVKEGGQTSETVFFLKERLEGYSLLEAHLKTGRTHQLRVQLAHLGHPIVGDDKYGDFDLNKTLQKTGLKRMFLHAASLGFIHPTTGAKMMLVAPLPRELEAFMDGLRAVRMAG